MSANTSTVKPKRKTISELIAWFREKHTEERAAEAACAGHVIAKWHEGRADMLDFCADQLERAAPWRGESTCEACGQFYKGHQVGHCFSVVLPGPAPTAKEMAEAEEEPCSHGNFENCPECKRSGVRL